MGRNKPGKPKKTPRWQRTTALQDLLGEFERDSLWSLLLAAGRSPGSRGRWTSVVHLTVAAAGIREYGSRFAVPADLATLLDAARADLPSLVHQEDFVAEDPRTVVEIAAFGRLNRVFPGNVERPVADLERMLSLAEIIDPPLRERLGFGSGHLIDATLQHIDAVMRAAHPSWPEGAGNPSSPMLTSSELDVEEPDTPPRSAHHAAALEWATRPAHALRIDIGASDSIVGPTLRVLLPDEDEARWLPLAVLPEALGRCVADLARLAAAEPGVSRRFAQVCAARVRRRLWRFGDEVIGAPDRPGGPVVVPGDVVQWILPVDDSRALAIQLQAGLSGIPGVAGPPAVARVTRALRSATEPVEVPFPGGRLGLNPGQAVVPIMVGASANHVVLLGAPGILHLSLEDLDWIAATARSQTDLYHFAQEVTRGGSRYRHWETIDVWEAWRDGDGAFFRGGTPPDVITFEPHRGAAEWQRATALTDVERALAALRLSPVRDWDVIEPHGSRGTQLVAWDRASPSPAHGAPYVHQRPPARTVHLHIGSAPLALLLDAETVGAADVPLDHDARELILRISWGFVLALQQVAPEWAAVGQAASVRGVRLTVQATNMEEDAFHLEKPTVQDGVLEAVLDLDPSAWAAAVDGAPEEGRRLMAEIALSIALQTGAEQSVAGALGRAWIAAPPTLSVSAQEARTRRNRMPAPIGLEPPLVAEVDREVARAALSSGAKEGRYSPEEAKALDRDVLAPRALALLDERIGHFDTNDVVRSGMVQLERTIAQQRELQAELRSSEEAYPLVVDAVTQQVDLGREHLDLRRALEVVVERAMHLLPGSGRVIHERDWAEVLAAAGGYVDAITRSEAIHFQLSRTGLLIDARHELHLVDWPATEVAPPALDYPTFSAAEADERLHGTIPEPPMTPRFAELLDRADVAFEGTLGTRATAVMRTLLLFARWPLKNEDPDAVAVPRAAVLDYLSEHVDSPTADLTATLDLLTRTGSVDSTAWMPWKLRSRRDRLLVRPIPLLRDGSLLIAPHYCEMSAQVYAGYWSGGQLPWSQGIPIALQRALANVRNYRNRELEDRTASLLREAGWRTAARIKVGDGARIGVPELTTEIDVVAGIPGSPWIELLEVKDPAPTFVPADMRSQFREFYENEGSHAKQLQRKDDELRPFASEIAAALRLPAGMPYAVRTRFVTRRVLPAAYASGPFPFSTLHALLAHLST